MQFPSFPIPKAASLRGLSRSDWGSRELAVRNVGTLVSDSFHHCVVPHPLTPRCQEGGYKDVPKAPSLVRSTYIQHYLPVEGGSLREPLANDPRWAKDR